MKLDFKNINFRALLTTRRYLLLSGLVFGLTGIMVLGAILPQIFSSAQLYQDNQVLAQKIQVLQSKVTALQQVKQLEQADRTKVDQALPAEKPLLQLMTAINTVAQQDQVVISEVQLSPGKIASQSASENQAGATSATPKPGSSPASTAKLSAKAFDSMTVGLKVGGTLAQINQFLEDIEKVVPITDVTSLQLTSAGRGRTAAIATLSAGGDIFQAELKLSAYYFTQPVAAAIEAPLPKVGAKEDQFLKNLNTFIFPTFQKQQGVQGGGLEDLFGLSQ